MVYVPEIVPDMVGEDMVGVVRDGEVAKTKAPEPVSSVTEAAKLAEVIEVVRLEEASVATNLLAVKPLKVMVPEEEMPVILVRARPEVITVVPFICKTVEAPAIFT
jgi:hypothetical protein